MLRAVNVGTLLALALAAPGSARAQEGDGCSWAVGAAANTSPAGRDWDLSTPESYWSMTPVLSQQCHGVIEAQRIRPWVGVDLVPALQHRYRAIGERGTLGALFTGGLTWRVLPRFSLGPHVVTNVTAWGLGARALYLRPPKNRLGLYGAEARLQWMFGTNQDFQAFLLVHVHHRWTGWYSEEEHLPDRKGQLERRWTVATGFDVGEIVGWRFEVRPGPAYTSPEIGVRLGALTNLFADAAVQPVGLGYVDIPLEPDEGAIQLELAAGTTRRDGAWVPLGGVSAQLDPADSVLQGQIGVLVGGGPRIWATVDGGVSWLW